MFLPACSQDFNPIEKVCRKPKTLLRASEVRKWEVLLPAIATTRAALTAKDALSRFASCG